MAHFKDEGTFTPKQFALGRASEAFAEDGSLKSDAHKAQTQAVVDQVLWAGARLGTK